MLQNIRGKGKKHKELCVIVEAKIHYREDGISFDCSRTYALQCLIESSVLAVSSKRPNSNVFNSFIDF